MAGRPAPQFSVRDGHGGLAPHQETARPLWNAYFAAPEQPGPEQSLHIATNWLIDARGRWRTKSPAAPRSPTELAHDLRLLLSEDRR